MVPLKEFLQYLALNRNASEHTVRAYDSDLSQFLAYAATAAGVPGFSLGRRLEDHLGWLERRRRGGRPLRRTRRLHAQFPSRLQQPPAMDNHRHQPCFRPCHAIEAQTSRQRIGIGHHYVYLRKVTELRDGASGELRVVQAEDDFASGTRAAPCSWSHPRSSPHGAHAVRRGTLACSTAVI